MSKQKQSVFKVLSAALGLAVAYRKTAKREADNVEVLRPHGKRSDTARGKSAATASTAKSKNSKAGIQNNEKRAGSAPQSSAGRNAAVPEEIPPRGWWEIAKRTAQKFSENDLMSEAASVTFYALLSLFPAITAMVSIYGLIADPHTIQGQLNSASGFIPSGGMQILQDQIKRLTESPTSGLSIGAIVGILTALWSANQGSKAMLSALNDVYGEREERGFVKLTAVSLAFTIGGIGTLLVLLGAIVVVPLVFKFIGIGGASDVIVKVLRWPLALAAIMAGLAVLYRFGPSRHRARWRWVTWGGAVGAVLWVVLSFGFSWYVEHFGNYNKTYGSLGAVIGFMTWIWLSSTVLLLGGQVNAEMEAQTSKDTTVGGTQPVGGRGAAAADTVA